MEPPPAPAAASHHRLAVAHSTPTQGFPATGRFPDPTPSQARMLHCLLSLVPTADTFLFDATPPAFARADRVVVRVVKPCGTGKTHLCAAFMAFVLAGLGLPKGRRPQPFGGLRVVPRRVAFGGADADDAFACEVPAAPPALPHAAAVLCPAAILDMWRGVLEGAGLRVRVVHTLKGKEAPQTEALRRLAEGATAADPVVFVADASVKTAKGGRAQLLAGFGRGADARALAAVVVDEGDALSANKNEAGEALPAARHTLLATAREGPAPPHTLLWEAEVAGRQRAAGGHAPLLELKATKAFIEEAAARGATASRGAEPVREEVALAYPKHLQASMEAFAAEERQLVHSHCGPEQVGHNRLFLTTEPLVRKLKQTEESLMDVLSHAFYLTKKDTYGPKVRKQNELAAVQSKLNVRRQAMEAAEETKQLVCPICLETWQGLQLKEGGCGGLRAYGCGHWTCAECADQNDRTRAKGSIEQYAVHQTDEHGMVVLDSAGEPIVVGWGTEVVKPQPPKCPICNFTEDKKDKEDKEDKEGNEGGNEGKGGKEEARQSKGGYVRRTLRTMGETDRLCVVYSDKLQRDTVQELLREEGCAFEDLDKGSLTKKLERLRKDSARVLLLGPGAQQGVNLHQLCEGTMHVLRVGALDANTRMQAEGRFTRMGSTHARLVVKRLRCELEDDEKATDISMLSYRKRECARRAKRQRREE